MGAGTNVQQRLVALHHLDAPWRPSDLEQREGRIVRQGNELYKADPEGFEVEINRYATERTYDARMSRPPRSDDPPSTGMTAPVT